MSHAAPPLTAAHGTPATSSVAYACRPRCSALHIAGSGSLPTSPFPLVYRRASPGGGYGGRTRMRAPKRLRRGPGVCRIEQTAAGHPRILLPSTIDLRHTWSGRRETRRVTVQEICVMTLRDKVVGRRNSAMPPARSDSNSGDESGDTQGLSRVAEMADESVQELAEAGQTYEAEAVEGLEDAADHPEQPAHTHEDNTRHSALEPRTGAS